MYILSHTLLPITLSPVPNGVLHIEKGLIKNIGSVELLENIPKSEIIDLSKHVITPGFVNTHAHLELTPLGTLPRNKHDSFSDWIEQIIEKKSTLDEQQIIEGYKKGVSMLMSSGVTTVLDNISFNIPWEIIPHFPIQIIPNAEVLGANKDVALDIYSHIKNLRDQFLAKYSGHTFLISPHSAHSLHPDVLKILLTENKTPLFIHLAESNDEKDYFQNQSGGIAKLILKRGIEIPQNHQDSGLNVIHKMNGDLSNITIIHGNYLSDSDLEIMVKNKMSVIHCPGSHTYFGHQDFSLSQLSKLGITIGIGTDSLASNESLSFLDELRRLSQNYPELTKEEILKMATINGALILGLENQIGSLEKGKKANLAVFELTDKNPIESIFKAVKVSHLLINGHQVSF